MKHLFASAFILLSTTTLAAAQGVPVIDAGNLVQATATATNTMDILNKSKEILTTVNSTLTALTGIRNEAQSLAQTALGTFSMSQAPNLGSILNGQNSFGQMGSEFQQVANQLIKGLQLVDSLSNGASTGNDQAFTNMKNITSAVTAAVAGTQSGVSSRTEAFKNASGQIGTAQDLKGAMDQNSQIAVQQAQTTNELVGVTNNAVSVLNSRQAQELSATSATSKIFQFDKKAAANYFKVK